MRWFHENVHLMTVCTRVITHELQVLSETEILSTSGDHRVKVDEATYSEEVVDLCGVLSCHVAFFQVARSIGASAFGRPYIMRAGGRPVTYGTALFAAHVMSRQVVAWEVAAVAVIRSPRPCDLCIVAYLTVFCLFHIIRVFAVLLFLLRFRLLLLLLTVI